MQGITQQPQYTKCRRWSESEARPCNHRPRSWCGTLSGVVGGGEVDKRTTLNDDLRRTILVSAVRTVDQEVVAIRIAEWLAGEGTAVDDEGTLLDLHSSTAAVIVAVVDGHSSALPDVDAIAAVDAGINAAVLARIDGGIRINDKGAEVRTVVTHLIGGDDLLLQIQCGGLGDNDAGRRRILNVVGLDILGNSHDAAVGQSLLQFRNVHHRVSGVLVIGVVEAIALHGVLGGVDGDGSVLKLFVHVLVAGSGIHLAGEGDQAGLGIIRTRSGQVAFLGDVKGPILRRVGKGDGLQQVGIVGKAGDDELVLQGQIVLVNDLEGGSS